MRALTNSESKARAIAIHGDRYTYERWEYTTGKAPIIVTCREHGDYETTYNAHVTMKRGTCPNCAVNKAVTEEEALRRCRATHGDKYVYDGWGYVSPKVKALITCRVHGHFEQAPERHWLGDRCPRCGKHEKWTTDRLVAESTAIFGVGTLDYSETVFVNTRTKFTLQCVRHGLRFEKTKSAHIDQRQGCPKCGRARTTGPSRAAGIGDA